MTQPELERFRTADGRALTYVRRGDGPPLVCHPGGPGGDSLLFENLGGLDRERTLVLLNPRGAGDSDPPADPKAYRLEDYAGDLEELRDRLGLDAMDLFGHSAGGFVGMVYAATFPERVRRLVLCGTFARFTDEWRRAFERLLAEREDDPRFADAVAARRERDARPPEDEEAMGRLLIRGLPLLFGRYGRTEQAFLERMLDAGGGFHVPALRYFNERVAPTFDLRPLLPRVRARTLVLTGELDVWGSGAASELESHLADATVTVLPGVGHMPWVEAAEDFREEVSGFLTA